MNTAHTKPVTWHIYESYIRQLGRWLGRLTRFYGIPLDTIGYYKERLKDFLSKRYRFPIFDLSDKKLDKVLNHFKTKKFDYINGYTSSIVLFGKR